MKIIIEIKAKCTRKISIHQFNDKDKYSQPFRPWMIPDTFDGKYILTVCDDMQNHLYQSDRLSDFFDYDGDADTIPVEQYPLGKYRVIEQVTGWGRLIFSVEDDIFHPEKFQILPLNGFTDLLGVQTWADFTSFIYNGKQLNPIHMSINDCEEEHVWEVEKVKGEYTDWWETKGEIK